MKKSELRQIIREEIQKLTENKYADAVETLVKPKIAAKHLKNLSDSTLSPIQFGAYLEDYMMHPKEYGINVKGKYYQAIVSAYEDIYPGHSEMNASETKKSDFYKEYVKASK
jgi:hypothetical protein